MTELTTCWDMISGAAAGGSTESASFAAMYRPLIIDFLGRRWRSPASRQDIDDAAQETLMECLREQGALGRAVSSAPRRLRPFLFGVTMNVARRFEEAQRRSAREAPHSSIASDIAPPAASTPAIDFDRAWAFNVIRQAREKLELSPSDDRAATRAMILRLRFVDGQPIRVIAEKLGLDPASAHHEYAAARKEFRTALIDVIRFESQRGAVDINQEVAHLMAHLA